MSGASDAAAQLRVTVVIPCLNEDGNLCQLVLDVRESLAETGVAREFLLVDNASSDGVLA